MSATEVIYGAGEVTVITVGEQGPPGAPGEDGADVAYVDAGDSAARARANHTGTQLAATISDFATAADARVALQKGAANGLAPLGSDGKLASSFLPALAITDTFPVGSQVAMLALTAEVGDIAVRTDLNKSYILQVAGASTLGNWQELLTPTDAVMSVNGQTGAVSLSASGLGALATSANLSDLASASTARANLGVAIGADVQAYNASLTALGALGTTGLMTQTSAGVYASRSIAAGSSSVTVTNGNGVNGNPTIDLAAATASLMGGVLLAGDLTGSASAPRVIGLQRVFNVKDYGAVGDGVTDDLAAINLAIAATNAALGQLYFPYGTYVVSADLTDPVSKTTWFGAGKGTTVIKSTGTYSYIISCYSGIDRFRLQDITFDLNNGDHQSGVDLSVITNTTIERCEFKNGAAQGWLLKISAVDGATDGIVNVNNKIIDCDFDGHAGTLEMLLLNNAKNTQIVRPTFKNKTTNGPVLGLWQKCYGTTITGGRWIDTQGNGALYYSVTVENTVIDDCYFGNTGTGIKGSNQSDHGLFGLTRAVDLKISNVTFVGGANSAGATAIQFGALDGASLDGFSITGYQTAIAITDGNTGTPASAINWKITNGTIKNNNASADVHILHPAIGFFDVGGSLYGHISKVDIYDNQGTQNQRYPIVFDGAYTWDNIDIVGNRLSADTGNGGTSVKLADGAALGGNVYIANNQDYSGTTPAQNSAADDTLVVHKAGTETVTGVKIFSADFYRGSHLFTTASGGGDLAIRPDKGIQMQVNGGNYLTAGVQTPFYAQIGVETGIYGLTDLTTARDVNIYTRSANSGGTDVKRVQIKAITGEVILKLQDKGGQVFNVMAYGAIGDGTTDDTTAIQLAATAIDTAGGGILFYPASKTFLQGTVNISSNTTVLMHGAIIKLKNSTNDFAFKTRNTAASPTSYTHDITFRGGYFNGNNANNTTKAGFVESVRGRNITVADGRFEYFKGRCISMKGSSGDNIQPRILNNQFDMGDRTDGVPLFLDSGCYDGHIEENDFGRSYRGMIMAQGGNGNHTISDNQFWGNEDMGLQIYQSHNNMLTGNTFDRNFGNGCEVDGSNNITFVNCKFSNNSFDDTANDFGYGAGYGTGNVASGIRVVNASTNIRIVGGNFSNPDATQKYGIVSEGASAVYYSNTTFSSMSTGNTNLITSGTATNLDSLGGTVTTISAVATNGFSASFINSSTTPVITIATTVTGILKGNGTAISAATAGTDYYNPGGTDVAVADGGTGSSTAAGARTNLGAVNIAGDSMTGALTITTGSGTQQTLASTGNAAQLVSGFDASSAAEQGFGYAGTRYWHMGRQGTTGNFSIVETGVLERLSIAPGGAATYTGTWGVSGAITSGSVAVPTISSTSTLTNKTMSGASNTFSSIPESAITNLVTDLAAKADLSVTLNTQTSSYTLVLTDAGKVVEMNNASANTLTVPPNSSVAFPIGTIIEVFQLGAGQVTITPGSGVTLRSDGAKLKTTAQYASASLRKRATDEWVVAGDVTT